MDGWLYPIETTDQLQNFRSNPPSGQLVVIVSSKLFIKAIIDEISEISNLQGVLVLPGEGPENFSPADPYPNKQFGLYPNSSMIWNPNGDGWNFVSQTIQIFALTVDNAEKLLSLAYENIENDHYPKWAIRMTSWMYTRNTDDVETCLRRGDCAPLGGRNIWGSLNDIVTSSSKRLIIAAASYDSNAFFHDLALGSDADISGAIALMGAAQALTVVDRASWVKEPLFVLFTGEAYGFIGSKSFVKDITNFTCEDPNGSYCRYPYRLDVAFMKLHLSMVDYYIELNQVGHFSEDQQEFVLFSHTEENAGNTSVIQEALQTASTNTKVRISDDVPKGQELPPSSFMSFLQADPTLSGVVLTEHQSEYRNPYFHSRLDNQDNVNLTALCEISLTLAKSLFLLGVNGTYDHNGLSVDDLTVNCTALLELYTCFTLTYECPLVRELNPSLKVAGTLPPPTNYVGVYSRRGYNYMATFILEWLTNTTAIYRSGRSCNSTDDCSKGESCLTGECIEGSFFHVHDALSPAFEYNPYDGKMYLVDDSPNLPQWTEAYWSPPNLKVFVVDSPWLGPIVFVLGIIELIVCTVVVYFGSRKLGQ